MRRVGGAVILAFEGEDRPGDSGEEGVKEGEGLAGLGLTSLEMNEMNIVALGSLKSSSRLPLHAALRCLRALSTRWSFIVPFINSSQQSKLVTQVVF